jgi:hypothetical protein
MHTTIEEARAAVVQDSQESRPRHSRWVERACYTDCFHPVLQPFLTNMLTIGHSGHLATLNLPYDHIQRRDSPIESGHHVSQLRFVYAQLCTCGKHGVRLSLARGINVRADIDLQIIEIFVQGSQLHKQGSPSINKRLAIVAHLQRP